MSEPSARGGLPSLTISYDKSIRMTILSPGEKFFIREGIESYDTLSNISPFLIEKVIDSVIGGEVQQLKKMVPSSFK